MNITILCSDKNHPVNGFLSDWIDKNRAQHEIFLARKKAELPGGDILFLVSCSEIIRAPERNLYGACLVLHASNLPQGRGWSPHIWQLLEGAEQIVVSMLEAEDAVDTGAIWHQVTCRIPPDALWHEINALIFEAELKLMEFAVANYGTVMARPQAIDQKSSYYPKRSPQDSELDPSRPLAELFNTIRVCDPVRYPAFFQIHGNKYFLRIERASEK